MLNSSAVLRKQAKLKQLLLDSLKTEESKQRIAAFIAAPTLDNAGWLHSSIVAAYVGDSAAVLGLDVLRAAYDYGSGFITDIDPPIAPFVSNIAEANTLALAIAQWIVDNKDDDLTLHKLNSGSFVTDTLIPSGYWSIT